MVLRMVLEMKSESDWEFYHRKCLRSPRHRAVVVLVKRPIVCLAYRSTHKMEKCRPSFSKSGSDVTNVARWMEESAAARQST